MNRCTTCTIVFFRKGLSLVLLTAYLLVFFIGPVHEIEHQSAEQEVCYDDNACHLRLVHQDTENGCDHEAHVSDEKVHCELCALRQLNNASEYYHWTYNAPVFDFVNSFSFKKTAAPNAFQTGILVRGPPINS